LCGDSHTPRTARLARWRSHRHERSRARAGQRNACCNNQPKTCQVRVEGKLGKVFRPKNIILRFIAQIGTGSGTGYVFEYTGQPSARFPWKSA